MIVFTDDFVEVYLCNRKDKEMVLQPLVHLISALFLSTPSLHLPLHIFSLPLYVSFHPFKERVQTGGAERVSVRGLRGGAQRDADDSEERR